MGPNNQKTIGDFISMVINRIDATTPKKILKSGRVTVVFWKDGSKTVVRRAEDEPDNEYNAFCAALAKRMYGSNNAIKKIIKTKTEVQKPKDDKD